MLHGGRRSTGNSGHCLSLSVPCAGSRSRRGKTGRDRCASPNSSRQPTAGTVSQLRRRDAPWSVPAARWDTCPAALRARRACGNSVRVCGEPRRRRLCAGQLPHRDKVRADVSPTTNGRKGKKKTKPRALSVCVLPMEDASAGKTSVKPSSPVHQQQRRAARFAVSKLPMVPSFLKVQCSSADGLSCAVRLLQVSKAGARSRRWQDTQRCKPQRRARSVRAGAAALIVNVLWAPCVQQHCVVALHHTKPADAVAHSRAAFAGLRF